MKNKSPYTYFFLLSKRYIIHNFLLFFRIPHTYLPTHPIIIYPKSKVVQGSIWFLVIVKLTRVQKKKPYKSNILFVEKNDKQYFLISKRHHLLYIKQNICFRYGSKKWVDGYITSFVVRPPPFFTS